MPLSEDRNIRDWLLLYLVSGVGRSIYHRLLEHFGSPSRVLHATPSELMGVKGISKEIAGAISTARTSIDIDKELRAIEKHNVEILLFSDNDNYPANLYEMSHPPPLLYKRGSLILEDRFSVTVVGSRACSPYGRLMCERIVNGLVDYGFTIVSGAAQGIDTYAHKTAIKRNGRSIAVLPCGLASRFSSRTRHLLEEIVSKGAVLSEFPMTRHEERANYSLRNSILAGLSIATVVIEAAPQSGSLMTAFFAIDENRSVFAVPGDVTKRTSRGCHLLIKQGAKLVESADDIIEDLQHIIGREVKPGSETSAKSDNFLTSTLNGLTGIERRLYDIILHSPMSFEELILMFGTEKIGALSNALLTLETRGLVKQLPGKIYTTSK